MQLNRRLILTTTLACAALVGSLAIGIAVGRSPLLHDAYTQDSKQEASEAILEKLEQTARRQAQPQPSFLDPFALSTLGGDPFEQMHQSMDRLLGPIGAAPSLFSFPDMGLGGGFSAIAPAQIEVEESQDEYRVVISIAEDSDMELSTELADNTLSVSAQIRAEVVDNSSGRALSSTRMSQFSRAIPFAAPVDATGLRTEKSDTAVVIRVPKLS